MFFSCQADFGKEGIRNDFHLLFTRHCIQGSERADFGKNSYPLAFVGSPRIPFTRSRVKGVTRPFRIPVWLPEMVGKAKFYLHPLRVFIWA
jgi:hypothetical protein